MTILTVAVVFSAIYLVFDLDKTEPVTKQLRDDVDYFNKHNESFTRLDQLQTSWKCCGVKDYLDYKTNEPPVSCMKTNKTSDSKGRRTGWEGRFFADDYQENYNVLDDHQEDPGANPIDLNDDAKSRKQRDSIFIPHLGRINTDSGRENEDDKDGDEEPKEFYPLGCLAKLEQTHMDQRSISVKLLITVATSSFASMIIIVLLIFIKKD